MSYWGAIAQAGASVLDTLQRKSQWEDQKKFTEDMLHRSHQYEVEDLRKAGLNPILSAGGKGASAPQPSAYQPGIGDIVSSALQAKNVSAQTENTQAATAKAEAEKKQIEQTTKWINTQHEKTAWENMVLESQMPLLQAQANFYRSDIGKTMLEGNLIGQNASSAINALGSLIETAAPIGKILKSLKGVTK